MTSFKPSPDHPWLVHRFKSPAQKHAFGSSIHRPPRTVGDELLSMEIERAILAGKHRVIPAGVSSTPYGQQDVEVMCGEGCSMKRAVRYG
jgi:hypothetical protein